MLTAEQQAQVVALRGLGRSFQVIADQVGASKTTVLQYARRSSEEIIRERRRVLEELLSQHRLLLRDRLEDLATFAGRLRQELQGRQLENVSTSALVKLYLDTLRAMQEQEPWLSCSEHASDIEQVYLFHDNT